MKLDDLFIIEPSLLMKILKKNQKFLSLILSFFVCNLPLQAGPTVQIKDLVLKDEKGLDSLINGLDDKSDGISISGVSSFLTSGAIDAINITKENVYEITDPKLTTFSPGEILTEADFNQALSHYSDIGGFGYEKSTAYTGLNGANIDFFGFKPLENNIIISPAIYTPNNNGVHITPGELIYSSTILIPWIGKGEPKNWKTIKKEGASFNIFLPQNLQLVSGADGNLEFNKLKITLPENIDLGKVTLTGVAIEISKDSFSMEAEAGNIGPLKPKDGSENTKAISFAIELADGGLKKMAFGMSGLTKDSPIKIKDPSAHMRMGFSNSYFQEFSGEFGNITKSGAPWYVKGNGLITVGAEPMELYGQSAYIASQEGEFGFNQNGRIEVSGVSKVLGFDITTAKFVFNPPSNFLVEIVGMPIGSIFRGDFDLNVHNENVRGNLNVYMGVPPGVPIIGGLNLGGVKAGATYIKDKYFEIRGEVYIQITPEIKSVSWEKCISGSYPHLHGCGWGGCSWHTHYWRKCFTITTPRIPAVRAAFGFSYRSDRKPEPFEAGRRGLHNDYYAAKYPWEIPFVYWVKDEAGPGWWVFNQNWDILWAKTTRGGIMKKGPENEKIVNIDVPSVLKTAVFRINYENENVGDVNAGLVMPDGKILNLKDGAFPIGFTAQGVTGAASHNEGRREVFFMIHNVQPGTYQLVIDDHAKLGGIRTELSSASLSPEADGVIGNQKAKGGEIVPDSYQIDWYAIDNDSPDADITFMIDQNNSGNNGIVVGGGKLKDFNLNEPFKFNSDQIPSVRPGYYYGLIAIDDGRNPVVYSYTDEQIWVDRDDAPVPVENIRTRAGNNKIIIEWDEPEGDFSHYNVHISRNENFDTIDKSIFVEKGVNSTVITGLENGYPYMVSVVTADDDYFESAMMEIQRVTPTQIPGSTKPVIISHPVLTAAEGYNYKYVPIVYDADEHNPAIKSLVENNDESSLITPKIWNLVQAPEGMSINPDAGVVEWVPNANQIGNHTIIIAATENVEKPDGISSAVVVNSTAIQKFEISVAPKWNISAVDDKVYFSSVPELTAIAGKQYSYQPSISTNDEFDLELLSGPHSMILSNGKLIWDVNETDNGSYVHIKAKIKSTGQEIENRYFVNVSSEQNKMYVGAELVKIENLAGKTLLGWTGDGRKFQIQRTNKIIDNSVWTDIGETIDGDYINFISLDDSDESTEYYRVKVLE